MQKNNILIIKKDNKDMFFECYDGIEKYYKYSTANIFLRVCKKLNLPLMYFFLGDWKKNIQKYDTVIFFDTGYSNYAFKYIKKRNKDIKIVFWYWNSLVEYKNKLIKSKYVDEIWTYNRFDAEAYNLNYCPQFYTRRINLKQERLESDILFLGKNKGRKDKILELKNILEKKGLKCDFNIIENPKNFFKYQDYLNKLSKTKCILDFSHSEYCGLSLRPLESLFFEKKLITNNRDIVNYDFYNSNNIFVLGVDDINKIKNFISTPYEKISDLIINNYDFEVWLEKISSKK